MTAVPFSGRPDIGCSLLDIGNLSLTAQDASHQSELDRFCSFGDMFSSVYRRTLILGRTSDRIAGTSK